MDININRENLNNLCFTDDIVLISDNLEKSETLLVRLTSASYKIGGMVLQWPSLREAWLMLVL